MDDKVRTELRSALTEARCLDVDLAVGCAQAGLAEGNTAAELLAALKARGGGYLFPPQASATPAGRSALLMDDQEYAQARRGHGLRVGNWQLPGPLARAAERHRQAEAAAITSSTAVKPAPSTTTEAKSALDMDRAEYAKFRRTYTGRAAHIHDPPPLAKATRVGEKSERKVGDVSRAYRNKERARY
jgi:hypothetical protein